MEALAKNQIHTSVVTGYSSEGYGVCRICSRAVFVPGVLMGEEVRVHIVKVTSSAVFGKAEEIVSPSPERQSVPCPVHGKCGGCTLLHMSYEEELRFKLARVNDVIARVGGLEFTVPEIVGAPSREGYRNKTIYNVAAGPVSGFFRQRSHDVIPVERCHIQPECSDRACAAVREWMAQFGVSAYDEKAHTGCVRHVFARYAFATGEMQVTLVVCDKPNKKALEALPERVLGACPELKSLVLCRNTTRGNTVLNGTLTTLWGKDTITDRLCGLEFELSPFSFYQINPVQAEKLYNRALEYAAPEGLGTVLDLYCGAGTISLCLARGAQRVIGAEIVADAVADARRNAERNGIKNAEFICADAGMAAQELARRGIRPDAIVVDPPRKGLSAEVIDAAVSMQPERIVYVSCDPATLARDMKIFAQKGYTPQKATAFDLFPATRHVETVVLLSKGEIDSKKIRVEFSLEDLDTSGLQRGATYGQIKERVLEQTGLKVSSLYIAQVKQKCGIIERENYNKPKSEDARQPQCPLEKEAAIMDALKHFGMI
jgi:23S rRNA (uracil1939-C5)-methyltransferase